MSEGKKSLIIIILAGRALDNVRIILSQDFQECANKSQAPGDEDLDRVLGGHAGDNRDGLIDGRDYVQFTATIHFLEPCLCKLVLSREAF